MQRLLIIGDLASILGTYCVRILPYLAKMALEWVRVAMRSKDPFCPGGVERAYEPIPIRVIRHDKPAINSPPPSRAPNRHPP